MEGASLGFRIDHQRIVEAVEKSAQRDAQRELDDLRFAEMGA